LREALADEGDHGRPRPDPTQPPRRLRALRPEDRVRGRPDRRGAAVKVARLMIVRLDHLQDGGSPSPNRDSSPPLPRERVIGGAFGRPFFVEGRGLALRAHLAKPELVR
jgi:hypothetical protein